MLHAVINIDQCHSKFYEYFNYTLNEWFIEVIIIVSVGKVYLVSRSQTQSRTLACKWQRKWVWLHKTASSQKLISAEHRVRSHASM
jgi:hypothetical protein